MGLSGSCHRRDWTRRFTRNTTIVADAGKEKTHFIDATRIAAALFGNSIGANMFMLGYAYQLGALPVSGEALEKAIEMNGEAVKMNVAAFRYGRRAAIDPQAVQSLVAPAPQQQNDSLKLSESLDETIAVHDVMIVLEGRLSVTSGAGTVEAGPGEIVDMPEGKVGIALDGSWVAGNWLESGVAPWPEWSEKMGTAPMPTQDGAAPGAVSMSGGWTLGRLSAVAREGSVLKAAANPRGAQGYAAGR